MYTYELCFNSPSVDSFETYNYKDSNDITIELSTTGIRIKMLYRTEISSIAKVIPRCHKACMLYLFRYGYIEDMKVVCFKELNDRHDVSEMFDDIKNIVIISSYRFYRYHEFSSTILSSYLRMKASNHLQIAFHAYAFSNIKSGSYERFLYSWIILNALYNIYDKNIRRECVKISKYLMDVHNISYNTFKSCVRDDVIPYIINITSFDDFSIVGEAFYKNIFDTCLSYLNIMLKNEREANKLNEIKNSISELSKNKNNNVFYKLFLIFEFGYYFRCNYFHGDKRLELFSRNDLEEMFMDKISYLIYEEFFNNFERIFELVGYEGLK